MRAGALGEAREVAGRARLTGSMLTRGTERYDFAALNECTDSNGIALSSDAGRHSIDLSLRCLADDVPLAIDLLAELVLRPAFPSDQLERLRGEVLNGLREAENDTRSVADRAFREAAYPGGHPFGQRVGGYVDSVERISRDEIARYHQENFAPDRLTVVVVGGTEIEAAFAGLSRVFGDWRPIGDAGRRTIADAAPPGRSQRIARVLEGKSQVDIIVGRPTIGRMHPDFYALDVGNLILGRLGLNGRIGANVRERLGLAYYSYSELEGGHGPGAWAARAGVNPANAERAIEAILDEVRAICDTGILESERADAANFLTGVLPLALDSNDGVARTIQSIETFDLGLDYVERYPAIIRGLTDEQIHVALRRHLDPDRNIISLAGPEISPGS